MLDMALALVMVQQYGFSGLPNDGDGGNGDPRPDRYPRVRAGYPCEICAARQGHAPGVRLGVGF